MKDLKYYIQKALKENFALGAMNFSNMESLQGIMNACKNFHSPAIISVSEGALSYMTDQFVISLANAAKEHCPYLFLHLDHGKSAEICKHAIDLGFDSVMIDGSALPFEENIAITKEVSDYAHKFNKIVEGELGQIQGVEDNVSVDQHHYTDPMKAREFVEKTNVDMLAVAIGTSHGAYKYKGTQTLRFDILQEIEKQLPDFPLVLHGASTVNQNLVELINENGGLLNQAIGIPVSLLKEAVQKHNVVKINTDTDLRLAVTAQTRKVLNQKPSEFDPRKYLGLGRDCVQQVVEDKIEKIFNSKNKA